MASGFDYRAFAALQSVNYGNGRKLNAGYNQLRSQLTNLQVKKTDNTDPIINISYDYYSGGGGSGGNNGRIRAITDSLDGLFSAALSYDDHNRLTGYGPNYQRSYTYDEWNNLRTVTSNTDGGRMLTNSSGAVVYRGVFDPHRIHIGGGGMNRLTGMNVEAITVLSTCSITPKTGRARLNAASEMLV